MRKRNGVTLVEVLIAIFVMAIGMMALLALFPLGAYRMEQALRDSRASQCGNNAAALAIARGLRQDPAILSYLVSPGNPPDPNAASQFVYVDPIGVKSYTGTNGEVWVAGNSGLSIRRCTPSFVPNADPMLAAKWFTLGDDITFSKDGVPASDPVARQRDYSWAYMMRRPRMKDDAVVDVAVVVYFNRLKTFLAEEDFPARFDTTRNVVTLDSTARLPKLRVGGWILDATPKGGDALNPHGYFYRVVGLTQVGTNSWDVEVERPFRDFTPNATAAQGTVVVLDSVVEVIEKSMGWSATP